MSFCPRCGAATQPGMAFCTACGGPLAPQPAPAVAAPGAAAPPPAYALPPRAMGPTGHTMEPWVVVVLMIVTLGIYAAFYWWRVSREMDEHVGRPGHAHNLVRIGVLVMVVSGVVLAFTLGSIIAAIVSAAISAEATGVEPSEEAMAAAILGSIGIVLLAGLAFLGGRIALLVGKYRVWEGIDQQQRARQHPNPLNPGLMLALALGGIILSGFGFILSMIVAYLTQERLNMLWSPA